MPCASFSMLDGPGGTNDAHGIEKLLLKTQVSLTSFLQSEVKIIHIIVQNNNEYFIKNVRHKGRVQHLPDSCL